MCARQTARCAWPACASPPCTIVHQACEDCPCCVAGTVTLPAGVEMVMPGDNVTANFELIHPVPMDPGLRFAIREGGRTVGAGARGAHHARATSIARSCSHAGHMHVRHPEHGLG